MLKNKDKLSIIILIMCVLSTFLVRFSYISLGLSILTLILSLLFSRKNIRIMLVIIIISIATIATNAIILYKQYNDTYVDVFKETNILLGTWNYNLNNSCYVFYDDYTYIQYDDVNNKDNYCTGTYKYSFGGTSNDGNVIVNDDIYYYYDLVFNIDYCVLGNQKLNNASDEKLIFGINKSHHNDLIFMDTKNNFAFKVEKNSE